MAGAVCVEHLPQEEQGLRPPASCRFSHGGQNAHPAQRMADGCRLLGLVLRTDSSLNIINRICFSGIELCHRQAVAWWHEGGMFLVSFFGDWDIHAQLELRLRVMYTSANRLPLSIKKSGAGLACCYQHRAIGTDCTPIT